MNTAPQPFQFFTASYLTQVENQKAMNMSGFWMVWKKLAITPSFITPFKVWDATTF